MSSKTPRHLTHPDRAARASFAKFTINTVIPHILKHNPRAKAGNESTERIYYNPESLKGKSNSAQSSNTKISTSGQKANLGKITGHFKPLNHGKNDRNERNGREKEAHVGTKPTDLESPLKSVLTLGEEAEENRATSHASASSMAAQSRPKISVIQSDTLDAAHMFIDAAAKDRRVSVLNMASFLRPGGGVINGAIAQEESLCLRSTLYTALDEKFYRLPKFGGLFTKDILVFRDSNNQDLPRADWYYVDVISVAALKRPDLMKTPEGKEVYEHEQDKEEMISKIKLILMTARQNKSTHLILGALGCGAYYNPPEEVAKMFRRVIFGDNKGRQAIDLGGIEEIVFAIFDNGTNLKVFRQFLDGNNRLPATTKAQNALKADSLCQDNATDVKMANT